MKYRQLTYDELTAAYNELDEDMQIRGTKVKMLEAENRNLQTQVTCLEFINKRYSEALETLFQLHKAMESYEIDSFILETLDQNNATQPTTSIKPEKDAHWLSLFALGVCFGALIAIGMEWI